MRKAIEAGAADGVNAMRETRLGKLVNRWQIALDMGRYGTDFQSRGLDLLRCWWQPGRNAVYRWP